MDIDVGGVLVSYNRRFTELWVLVPAYNEEKRILAALDALNRQEDRHFTVCVVDNASTDSTVHVVASFAESTSLSIVVLCEPTRGVGHAVDAGARYAIANGARYLARTDADSIPLTTWTREARRALESGIEFACGTLLARQDENSLLARATFCGSVSLIAFGEWVYSYFGSRSNASRYVFYAGCNMAITVDLYIRSGGMPRQPAPTDRKFMEKVLGVGGRVQRVASMRVATSTRRFRALGIMGAAKWYLGAGAETADPR
jgi:glycosyltransferase involved in cell wall biosynthesis